MVDLDFSYAPYYVSHVLFCYYILTHVYLFIDSLQLFYSMLVFIVEHYLRFTSIY